ncbi:MAG: acetate/propionate family kinase, partial [Aquificaceae bacterium]
DVDAGVILHMLRSGVSVEELERRLYRESGIRAIAGVSDFEELLTLKRNGNKRAILAFEAFLHRLLKYVGAYWFLLEGKVDALVFSGGIGENSPEVREELCKRLAFLGVELDQEANRKNQEVISSKGSSVKVLVIQTQEELEMVNIFTERNKII